MADIKKYKFKQDVQGIEYGQNGNNPVSYKKGDAVYGVIYYEGGDLVFVNTSGIFDNVEPTMAVSMAYLEPTDDDVKEDTGAVTESGDTNQNQTETTAKYAFWNQKFELPLFKLFTGAVAIWGFGYVVGMWLYKKK
jgi:hypothetical protein